MDSNIYFNSTIKAQRNFSSIQWTNEHQFEFLPHSFAKQQFIIFSPSAWFVNRWAVVVGRFSGQLLSSQPRVTLCFAWRNKKKKCFHVSSFCGYVFMCSSFCKRSNSWIREIFSITKFSMHENDYGEIWMVESPNGGVEDLEFTPQQKMNAALWLPKIYPNRPQSIHHHYDILGVTVAEVEAAREARDHERSRKRERSESDGSTSGAPSYGSLGGGKWSIPWSKLIILKF